MSKKENFSSNMQNFNSSWSWAAYPLFLLLFLHIQNIFKIILNYLVIQILCFKIIKIYFIFYSKRVVYLCYRIICASNKFLVKYVKIILIADFGLSDDDTCRATIRMFLQCNLVQQFHVPYDVSIEIHNNQGIKIL